MFKQFIHTLSGSDIYLAISLLIFVVFFIGMSIWLFLVDKKYIQHMKQLPVEDAETPDLFSGTGSQTRTL